MSIINFTDRCSLISTFMLMHHNASIIFYTHESTYNKCKRKSFQSIKSSMILNIALILFFLLLLHQDSQAQARLVSQKLINAECSCLHGDTERKHTSSQKDKHTCIHSYLPNRVESPALGLPGRTLRSLCWTLPWAKG